MWVVGLSYSALKQCLSITPYTTRKSLTLFNLSPRYREVYAEAAYHQLLSFADNPAHSVLRLRRGPGKMLLGDVRHRERLTFRVAVAGTIAPEERSAFGAGLGQLSGELFGVSHFDEQRLAATERLGEDETNASFHGDGWNEIGRAHV